nr:HNH endonuclease signature motif containing protein [uncultured Aminipila sp.]
MAQEFAIQFYNSDPWKELRMLLIIERGGKCARCGKVFMEDKFYLLIGHHKIELTKENISDPSISLNPNHIEIICLDCHNKEHKRFGHKQGAYIVWGSPLSGKNTFVNQTSKYGDLIIDIDSLWQAISNQGRYMKPNNLKANVFGLRECLYDQIRMRLGSWYDCYIIGGFPNKLERDNLERRLGATSIYIESTKEECLIRAESRPAEWKEYIENWWREYERGR